jgi:hypothetical protein
MDVRLAMVLSLCAACGASEKDAGGTGGGSGEGSSAADESSTSAGGEQLTHGTVRFEFRRSESQASSPAVGTVSISITTTYRDCLSAFYEENPSMRQTGPDGEAIFGSSDLGGEGWTDRLCESSPCSVTQIEQRLDPIAQLTVVYAVPGFVENTTLPFGPLPTSATAGCPDPIVRASVGGVKGHAQDGTVVWEAASIEPLDAVTNQEEAIEVGMEAVGD